MQPDITAGAAAERLQLRDRGLDDAVVDVELGKARRVAGAGAVHIGLVTVEADQVGYRGEQEATKEAALEEGLAPLMAWVKRDR